MGPKICVRGWMTWRRALGLAVLVPLSGCAGVEAAIKPPPCPAPSAAVEAELIERLPAEDSPAWRWIEAIGVHCDQIEVLRGG